MLDLVSYVLTRGAVLRAALFTFGLSSDLLFSRLRCEECGVLCCEISFLALESILNILDVRVGLDLLLISYELRLIHVKVLTVTQFFVLVDSMGVDH